MRRINDMGDKGKGRFIRDNRDINESKNPNPVPQKETPPPRSK